ncbi:MAG: NADP-dependent oxidoreductase [Armatimonadota bacterium]
MATMKAVRIHEFGGPSVLKYEDVPRPEPGAGEVLVRVCATGVNPFDFKVRQGKVPGRTLPIILGRDLSGIVEAVGPGVTGLRVGNEVYGLAKRGGDGSYAEYIVTGESDLALKPRSISSEQAAAVPLTALVAWQALFDIAHLTAGQTVLIHGAAGGVGHYAVQLAKWKGATVIGTATGDGIEFVRKLGADEVIDYTQVAFETVVHDVDVVLDLVDGETQDRSWKVLKKGGILVSSLGIRHPETADERGVRGVGLVAQSNAGELSEIAKLIDSGALRPAVQTVFPLEEVAKAHELLETGTVKGKVVLKVNC